MKASDYIAEFLSINGITAAFGMSGGAILHTVDALYSNKLIKVIFTTNEQFAAFEADGYARYRSCEKPGVCFATSGPGASNLLTGIATSYFDSIPMIVLTGQVARHRIKGESLVRQFGFQELDIVRMATPITKATFQPKNSAELKVALQQAFILSLEGRQGPVLIDLPDDLQREDVSGLPETIPIGLLKPVRSVSSELIEQAVQAVKESKSPLVLIGNGARYASEEVNQFVNKFAFPVVSSWAGMDILKKSDHYLGTVGTYSPNLNILFDHCDLLISIGCRLSNNIIGSIGSEFAPQSKKIIIDIDQSEIDKLERIGFDDVIGMCGDLGEIIPKLKQEIMDEGSTQAPPSWWKSLIIKPRGLKQFQKNETKLNSIDPIVALVCEEAFLKRTDIFVDTGNTLAWVCNAISKVKNRPRVFSSWNNTPMGYALPAAIGAATARNSYEIPTFCFIGDGGMGICLAELAVAKYHRFPLKIFLVENGGHNIQKQTIETWLDGRYAGVSKENGLSLPNYEFIDKMFDIKTILVDSSYSLVEMRKEIGKNKITLFRVIVNENLRSFPIVPFGRRISDPICPN